MTAVALKDGNIRSLERIISYNSADPSAMPPLQTWQGNHGGTHRWVTERSAFKTTALLSLVYGGENESGLWI